MLSVDVTGKPWAVTPEKIAEAVRRLVAAAAPTRLSRFLRGLLMPIDLIVTSQALYDSRALVLYAGD